MKRVYLLLLIISSFTVANAQAPQRIPFQALARDANDHAVAQGTPVKLRFTLLDQTSTGSPVFNETDTATVNRFGIVTAQIGTLGNLAVVNWGNGAKYLKVEIDINNTGTFSSMGVPQLISVPYALYAANSAQGPTGATGPNGTNGLTGATGPAGLNGATGPTGAGGTGAGPTGAKGATGLPGVPGQDGTNGTDGTNGVNGSNGSNGATGLAGPTGAAGGLGSGAGATGAAGIKGPTGPTGTNGVTGPQGASPAGAAGSTGKTGATGAAGGLGGVGPQGPQGHVGASGLNGATGHSGNSGFAGTGGPAGVQGPAGTTGPVGPTGVSGFYGLVYIAPVDVVTPGYTGTTSWTTFDASAYIPTTAKAVVLGAESYQFQPDGTGLVDGLIYISQQGGVSPQYLLHRNRSSDSGDSFARANQGKFPCQNGRFDYMIPTPGFDGGLSVRLIGYVP